MTTQAQLQATYLLVLLLIALMLVGARWAVDLKAQLLMVRHAAEYSRSISIRWLRPSAAWSLPELHGVRFSPTQPVTGWAELLPTQTGIVVLLNVDHTASWVFATQWMKLNPRMPESKWPTAVVLCGSRSRFERFFRHNEFRHGNVVLVEGDSSSLTGLPIRATPVLMAIVDLKVIAVANALAIGHLMEFMQAVDSHETASLPSATGSLQEVSEAR